MQQLRTEQTKILSSISPSLLRFVLFRGTFLAGIGSAILLFAGIFLPAKRLDLWGLPFFLLAFGLIAWGLIPYRRLKRLETNPYVLLCDDKEEVHFFARGKLQLSIRRRSIKDIMWVEKKKRFWLFSSPAYGIEVALHQPRNATLFFPYFSKASFEEFVIDIA